MSDDDKPGDDYEVGYAKPPKNSRFKAGQSGNKRGRPKGARGLRNVVLHDAAQLVTVTEGGKKRRKSKVEVLVQATFNRAIKGDSRAATQYYDLLKRFLEEPDGDPSADTLSPEEEAILQRIRERYSPPDSTPQATVETQGQQHTVDDHGSGEAVAAPSVDSPEPHEEEQDDSLEARIPRAPWQNQ